MKALGPKNISPEKKNDILIEVPHLVRVHVIGALRRHQQIHVLVQHLHEHSHHGHALHHLAGPLARLHQALARHAAVAELAARVQVAAQNKAPRRALLFQQPVRVRHALRTQSVVVLLVQTLDALQSKHTKAITVQRGSRQTTVTKNDIFPTFDFNFKDAMTAQLTDYTIMPENVSEFK